MGRRKSKPPENETLAERKSRSPKRSNRKALQRNPYLDPIPDEFTLAEKAEREAEAAKSVRTFRPARTDVDLKGIFPPFCVAQFVPAEVPYVDVKKVNGRVRAFIPVGTARSFLTQQCVPYAHELVRGTNAKGMRIPIPTGGA